MSATAIGTVAFLVELYDVANLVTAVDDLSTRGRTTKLVGRKDDGRGSFPLQFCNGTMGVRAVAYNGASATTL